jgi:hypothetical protein
MQRLRARAASSNCSDDLVSVLPVQQPAEIAYNRSLGATPVLLVASLVLGAIVASASRSPRSRLRGSLVTSSYVASVGSLR